MLMTITDRCEITGFAIGLNGTGTVVLVSGIALENMGSIDTTTTLMTAYSRGAASL